MNTLEDAIALAASHGLRVSADGATLNEAGLDYRVVMASDATGRRWVLRIPRRTDVSESMAGEVRILNLVAPVLAAEGIAVPDWQIIAPDLIAYPALPGAPGLTLHGGPGLDDSPRRRPRPGLGRPVRRRRGGDAAGHPHRLRAGRRAPAPGPGRPGPAPVGGRPSWVCDVRADHGR